MANDIAPAGKIYVCVRCGKKSKTKYGFYSGGSSRGSDTMPDGSRVSDGGYDESCMPNSALVEVGDECSDEFLDYAE